MDNLDYKHIPFELDEKEASEGKVVGYASIYNNVDYGGDVVLPGAFEAALSSSARPKMLWQHDPSQVIGVWEKMTDTAKGLKIEGRIIKGIQKAEEALILMKEKAIDGLSIGYRAKEFEFEKTAKGLVRKLKAVDLFEVSVVTFPMNPKALVTDAKQLQTPREVEVILRNAGVPATFAKLVASHGFEGAKKRLTADPREVEDEDAHRQGLKDLLNEIQGLQRMMKNAQG